MMTKTLQERLGYSAQDRLLILHADDVGMCESTISAWREMLDFGLLTSASAMAPCSWFAAAAKLAGEIGETADLGLHLTLNCEWTENYRWGPITGNDTDTGLVNAEGYFHSLAKPTHEQAKPTAVRRELQAQIARAKRAGVDLTHLDSHMFTLWHSSLMPLFIELAVEHNLPAFLVRETAAQIARSCSISLEEGEILAQQLNAAESAGRIIPIDSWHILPFGRYLDPDSRLRWVCDRMDEMGPGVHSFNGHPAKDSPELRAIAPDFETRTNDYALFTSEAFRQEISKRGFKLIGLRGLRHLFQNRAVSDKTIATNNRRRVFRDYADESVVI